MFRSQAIQTLLVLLVSLLAVAVASYLVYDVLFRSTQEYDPYAVFSRFVERYITVVSSSYYLDKPSNTLFVTVYLQNVGDRAIPYRIPIPVYVYLKLPSGEEGMKLSESNVGVLGTGGFVENSSGVFYPGIIYKLTAIFYNVPAESYPYRVVVSLDGVHLTSHPAPGRPERITVVECNSCSGCQGLLDSYAGGTFILKLDKNVGVDKSPCIELNRDYGSVTFDCNGFYFVGSGSGVVFDVNGGSGITVANCNIKSVETAILLGEGGSTFRSIIVDDVNYVVKAKDPFRKEIYDNDVEDVMYKNKKFYLLKPGSSSIYNTYLPLAVWSYGLSSGGVVNVDGNLEKAYPLVAVVDSSKVSVTNFSAYSYDPYPIVVLDSSDINISKAMIRALSLSSVLSLNSSVSLFDINIYSSSAEDLNLFRSDVEIGDLNISNIP